ncbi:hypothetical protein FRACA_220010 [Frankia canadensis]|uniref:Uncharacterized protein n=1 Tax=Frankia canadensis TaxID=1836972 RepID=A0A2I2KQZ5_9ACTN|nr:hypothetical protein FRACA_220010 [Frankia canadensis]SOU55360.1 hypothetical protein FRACA_220010 [Frankia canadensis]
MIARVRRDGRLAEVLRGEDVPVATPKLDPPTGIESELPPYGGR